MEKKLLALCFPHEFSISARDFGEQGYTLKLGDYFVQVLHERYIENGYELVIVHPKNLDVRRIHIPIRDLAHDMILVNTDGNYGEKRAEIISSHDNVDERLDKLEWADFSGVSKLLKPQRYSKIAVAGFKVNDCVKKLARHVHAENRDTIVDAEMTDWFPYYSTTKVSPDYSTNTINAGERKLDPDFITNNYEPCRARNSFISKVFNASYRDLYKKEGLQSLFDEPCFGCSADDRGQIII